MSNILSQNIGFMNPSGFPGQIANSNPITQFGATYQGETPIKPGIAVKFGTENDTCDAFTSAADKFLGILINKRDMITAMPGQDGIAYEQGDAVAVLLKGFLWVAASENVDVGDDVAVTADGALAKTGVFTIPNAKWMTNTAQNETGIVWLA